MPDPESDNADTIPFHACTTLVNDRGQIIGSLAVWDNTARPHDASAVRNGLRLLGQQAVDLFLLHESVCELSGLAADRGRAEEAARWQAHHDMLTGLPNRTLFLQCASEALDAARTRNKKAEAAGKAR